MNPIPLAAPDGQIYAYACSFCRHVGGGSSLMCPPELAGPHPVLVESSLRDATTCCLCPMCGAVKPLEHWGWNCADCAEWVSFGQLWYILASWIGAVGTLEEKKRDWDKRFEDDDD